AEDGALVGGGHVAARPVLGAADRSAAAVEHDHEAGQVLVDAAQAVSRPAAQAGVAAQHAAGVHHQHGRAVLGGLGVHGVQEGDVTDAARQVREQVADELAALAVLPESPLWTDDAALIAVAAAPEGPHRDSAAIEAVEARLVVEGIDLAG